MYRAVANRGIGGGGCRPWRRGCHPARSRRTFRAPHAHRAHPANPRHLTADALVDPAGGRLVVAALAALVAGVVNALAGGGTLLTFPALIAAGLSPLAANATSTVALVPAALSSMLGYRRELTGARRLVVALTLPSLVGGGLGALLLLRTPGAVFDQVVPWLVLGATALFMIQRPLIQWLRGTSPEGVADETRPLPLLLVSQLGVGVYGGYFGAGVGILMLASLGFLGFTNIHRMNGLKNWGGFCMNLVAAAAFAISGIVDWPVALTMATASVLGGYLGSRLAQRLPQAAVRLSVAVVGLTSGIWLLWRA